MTDRWEYGDEEDLHNDNAKISRRNAFIGGAAILVGGAAGIHSLIEGKKSEDKAGQAGAEAAEEEVESSFREINLESLDYDLVDEGLSYVEDQLGEESSEEIITKDQFELYSENNDSNYLEAEVTWRLNEDRSSLVRHRTELNGDTSWTGRWNLDFDTALTFVEGMDREVSYNLLEEHSGMELNDADIQYLEDIGYEEVQDYNE